ncbi:VOC family protein [Paraburkholderia kururiensis]|uniref:VOC family protein n=1 Tax=Paraburkholderia kururiensis TaxID=984307 RepID=UPI000347180E|nr:VOC family protein [Paraburkholderia kururiensis]
MSAPFRYRKLGYVALGVTDVKRSADFARDIVGLEPSGIGENGDHFFRCGPDRHCVVLAPAKEAGFKRAAWDLETMEDVDRAFHHFDQLGFKPAWLAQEEKAALNLTISPAFRVRDPFTGALFEYYSGMDQTIVKFPERLAKIQCLGHTAISHPDMHGAIRHFVKHFGFVVSDYVGEYVTFVRAFPNPFHHSFGVGGSRSGKPHFNHINFMVTDIDDIGRLQYRLQRNNVKIVFGPGRHPTSDSIFLYFLDPDGMSWEYSFGMEMFPEVGARSARSMSARPEDFDVWGARPDPEFTRNGIVETA